MHRTLRRGLVAGSAALATVATVAALAGPATAGGRPFAMALSGAQEAPVNTHGADRGSVELTLNQGQGEICFSFGPLTLTDGEPLPHAGHIHEAPVGVAGPIVVHLFGPASRPTSYPTGERCVAAPKDLVKEIRQNPGDYYVNLHNTTHPAGVVRGQLAGPGT